MMKFATKQIDEENEAVVFHFSNGKKLECRLSDLPAAMVTRSALHGIAQKVGDSFAGATENGWSVADAMAEAEATWLNVCEGTWANRGRVSTVVEAMAAVFDRDYDEALAVWNGLDKKAKTQVAKDPAILKYLAEKELAKAKSAKPAIDIAKLFK